DVFHAPKRDRESGNAVVAVAVKHDAAVIVHCAHARSELVAYGRVETLPTTTADSQPQSILFDGKSVGRRKFLAGVFTHVFAQLIRRRIYEFHASKVDDFPNAVFIRFQRQGVFAVGRLARKEKPSALVESCLADRTKARGTERLEPRGP